MTAYKVGDLVRATKGDQVIQGNVLSGGGVISNDLGDWTIGNMERKGWTVELIKAAPSPTRKSLDDAPRNSFVRGESASRTFWKSRNLKWYEIIHDWQGDGPKVEEADERQMDIVADWIDHLPKFTLTTPNGD